MAISLSHSRMLALPLRLANDFSDRRCTLRNHIVATRPRAELVLVMQICEEIGQNGNDTGSRQILHVLLFCNGRTV